MTAGLWLVPFRRLLRALSKNNQKSKAKCTLGLAFFFVFDLLVPADAKPPDALRGRCPQGDRRYALRCEVYNCGAPSSWRVLHALQDVMRVFTAPLAFVCVLLGLPSSRPLATWSPLAITF